jgi:quinolinate synthase
VPADREILFVPDQNLGQWVSQRTGRKMRLWPGSCYAHVQFTVQALEKVRAQFPGAPIVAHPECVQAVRDLADEVCSTELMVGFSRSHPSDQIIVVTESGMLHRLRREVPDKTFIAGPTDSCACNDCRYMKMNTIEKVRDALKTLSPAIEVPEPVRSAALIPIQRMLDWSKR